MIRLYTDLKVSELRSALKTRKLSSQGRRDQLRKRLSDWIEDSEGDPNFFDFSEEFSCNECKFLFLFKIHKSFF